MDTNLSSYENSCATSSTSFINVNNDVNDLQQLICGRFGFDEVVYKRVVVGKNDFYYLTMYF